MSREYRECRECEMYARARVCVFWVYRCVCVHDVLIRDQCANLCAKWNIYTQQLDTSGERGGYWTTVSR